MTRLATLFLAVMVGVVPASGAELPPPGRYAFMQTEGGILRLDTATGDITLCKISGSMLTCAPATGERGASDGVAALRGRIAELEHRIDRIESNAPAGAFESGETAVDRVAVLAGRMMERLLAMVRQMKQELAEGRL
jgi:hypothetical protein